MFNGPVSLGPSSPGLFFSLSSVFHDLNTLETLVTLWNVFQFGFAWGGLIIRLRPYVLGRNTTGVMCLSWSVISGARDMMSLSLIIGDANLDHVSKVVFA